MYTLHCSDAGGDYKIATGLHITTNPSHKQHIHHLETKEFENLSNPDLRQYNTRSGLNTLPHLYYMG